jgi:hypothetical protein
VPKDLVPKDKKPLVSPESYYNSFDTSNAYPTKYGLNPFSIEGLIDFFGINQNPSLISCLQEYFDVNTSNSVHNLYVLSDPKAQTLLVTWDLNIFTNLSFLSVSDLLNSNLAEVGVALADEIELAAVVRPYQLENLRSLFPNLHGMINNYELGLSSDDFVVVGGLSTPDTKLYYPEPFIASPSFVHEDLWFIHILHYQHWLWFMFISLIMFYFITFINVVRWCSLRSKPKRETRGVSRSKCADLITGAVPAAWAASIIISESVDATDYYDGFGPGEIVRGIRAYQWGWEYSYPKDIDLNYNANPSYSSTLGNSLKDTTVSSTVLSSNTLWKYYQNRNNNKTTPIPAHLVLSPTENAKITNFMKFADLGTNNVKDSTAFKKIQYFSKTNPQQLYENASEFNLRCKKLSDLYFNDSEPTQTHTYDTLRQYNSALLSSPTSNLNPLPDPKSLATLRHHCSSKSRVTAAVWAARREALVVLMMNGPLGVTGNGVVSGGSVGLGISSRSHNSDLFNPKRPKPQGPDRAESVEFSAYGHLTVINHYSSVSKVNGAEVVSSWSHYSDPANPGRTKSQRSYYVETFKFDAYGYPKVINRYSSFSKVSGAGVLLSVDRSVQGCLIDEPFRGGEALTPNQTKTLIDMRRRQDILEEQERAARYNLSQAWWMGLLGTEALHETGSEFSFVPRKLDIPREKQLWESSSGGSNCVSSSRSHYSDLFNLKRPKLQGTGLVEPVEFSAYGHLTVINHYSSVSKVNGAEVVSSWSHYSDPANPGRTKSQGSYYVETFKFDAYGYPKVINRYSSFSKVSGAGVLLSVDLSVQGFLIDEPFRGGRGSHPKPN